MTHRRWARLAACLAAVLLLPAAGASAQGRNLDRDFGRSERDWCREDYGDWRRESFCEVREQTIAGGGVIDLDTGGNGGVHVRGSNRSDIRLRARVLTWGSTEAAARSLANDVRIDISGGRVRVDAPDSRRGESWSVSFELEVPRHTELLLNTRNGGIAVHDYEGRADLRTVNGGIALAGVAGDIHGETRNGGIAIELAGRQWDGSGLELETRNGGVVMTIPRDYSAELDTGTVNGGIDIDFPVTVQGRLTNLSRSITTTLGSGGARLRVRTTNGGVRIRQR